LFESNSFDAALKAAKKFDAIISKSSALRTLANLSATLAANMGASDKQAQRLQKRISDLVQLTEEQARKSARITKGAYDRVKFYDRELSAVDKLEAKLKKRLELKKQEQAMAKTTSAKAAADRSVAGLEDRLKKAGETRKIIKKTKTTERSLSQVGALKYAINDAFGGVLDKLSKFTGILAPFIIFAFILKALLGAYRQALKSTIDVGLDASQRVSQITKAQNIVADSAKDLALSGKGSLLALEDVIKAADALSTKLGTLDVSSTLIRSSAELSRRLGVSADEAASILQYFTRIQREVPAVAANNVQLIKATALQNKFNAGLAIKDFAANTANFAKSARTGAVEMAQAVIQARQLGVAFSTISGIADNIVSNFEGALEAQATIGAFAPGFDMSGLLVASQFGTDKDIGRELRASVQSMGMEFDQLPRSFKLAISQGLGVSVEELGNLMQGEDKTQLSPGDQAMIDAQNGRVDELQKALVNPLAAVERGIFGIWSLLVRVLTPFAGQSELASAMSDEQLNRTRGTGSWLGMAANKEFERRGAISNLEQLKSKPVQSPGYAVALQSAYDRVREIDPNADILKDMKKQQEAFNKTWIDFMSTQANKPVTVVTQIDGREIARAMTKPGISRSSGQF
jgi:hypothetical protein